MNGQEPLAALLRQLSEDADLQAARRKFEDAVNQSTVDEPVKRALLEGDRAALQAALAHEYAQTAQFVLYFC